MEKRPNEDLGIKDTRPERIDGEIRLGGNKWVGIRNDSPPTIPNPYPTNPSSITTGG